MKNLVQKKTWILSPILLVLLCGYMAFANLGAATFSPGDESMHVRAAQSILAGSDFWAPEINRAYYLNKPFFKLALSTLPPLFMGESTLSYRLLDALAGLGTALILYLLALSLWKSHLRGALAVLFLFGCKYYVLVHGIRHAVQDSMLVFLTTAALALFYILVSLTLSEQEKKKTVKPLYLGAGFGFLTALALLTKSLAGLIAPVVAAAYLLSSKQTRSLLRLFLWPLLIAFTITALICAAYFLAHPAAFSYSLGHHLSGHVLSNRGFVESTWSFFLERLIIDRVAFPPEILLPALGFTLYCYFKKHDSNLLFLSIWAILPVVLYSLIKTKYTWYIQPAFPAMALIIAFFLGEMLERLKDLGLSKAKLPLLFIIVGFLSGAYNLLTILSTVSTPGRTDSFEKLVKQLQSFEKSAPNETPIVFLQPLDMGLALYEIPYMNMIQKSTKRVRKIKRAKYFLEKPETWFSLSSAIDAYHLMKTRKPHFYAPLKGALNRHDSYLALSYIKAELQTPFKPVNQNFLTDFVSQNGLEPKLNSQLPLTHHFRGDFVLRRLGAKLLLKGSCHNGQTEKPLLVKMNSKKIHSTWHSKENIWETQLEIDPGLLNLENNSLQLIASGCKQMQMEKILLHVNLNPENITQALKNVKEERQLRRKRS